MTDTFLAHVVNGEWLDAQVFPPLEEIVPAVVTEGFGILVGPPKAGKSWLVANLGLACAAGKYALGRVPVQQRPVFYLALEDGHRRLQSRFRTVLGGGDIPAGIEVLTSVQQDMALPTIAEWLLKNLHSKPLVILDTLGRARPQRRPGDDPYIADYQFGAQLKQLTDDVPGSGLLAVHHSRKATSTDFVDAVSGTQGIAGAADYVIVLSRPRTSPEGVLAITGRDVDEKEIAVRTEGGRWALDGDDVAAAVSTLATRRQTAGLGDRSAEALQFVQSRSETRPGELASHLGIDNKQAGVYLSRLAEAERIQKRGRGVYGPLPMGVETVESVETAGRGDFISTLGFNSVENRSGYLPGNTTETTLSTHPHPFVKDRGRGDR